MLSISGDMPATLVSQDAQPRGVNASEDRSGSPNDDRAHKHDPVLDHM